MSLTNFSPYLVGVFDNVWPCVVKAQKWPTHQITIHGLMLDSVNVL